MNAVIITQNGWQFAGAVAAIVIIRVIIAVRRNDV